METISISTILCDVRMMYTVKLFFFEAIGKLRQLVNCLLFSFAFDLFVLITGVEKINLISGRNLSIKSRSSLIH